MKLASGPQPASAVEPAAFRGGLLQRQGLEVSQPGDALETQATSAARRVVQMPAMPSAAPGMATHASSAVTPARVQRQTPGASAATLADAVTARLPSRLAGQRGQGQDLPPRLRRDMEARFGARFDGVRVHTGAEAAALSRGLQARAFTTGGDVFFGDGQFQPDSASGRELLAHELAHTVQQGAAPVVEPAAVAASSASAGAARTPRIQRSVAAGLSRAPSDSLTRVMRVPLPGAVLNTLAGWAANLPGFTLLTVVLGRNPINGAAVDRSIVNLLRGFIGLIPGGEALWQVLQRYGVINTLGGWAQQAVDALGLTFDTVRGAFTRFVDSLGVLDVLDPGGVWDRARAIFGPIVARITAFVARLITQAVAAVKAALMPPLSEFCRQIPGYGLVTVMLGRDPFTDAPVARTPLAIVRAFAEFIPGGREKVDQLVQSGALDRAYQWFVAETTSRNLTWTRVTGSFAAAWATLQLSDVLQPIATLQRIVGMFRPLMSDLIGFAGAALMKLLELIYEAAMGAGGRRILDILLRARSTFNIIIRDPVGFLRNLMGAVGQGVRQFMARILEHLREGVIRWLTGPVAAAGVQMPERWDLRGIIGFVLQILGLTWARVRGKLVALIGEPAMGMIERGLQIIQDIRERGLMAALRERVTEFFGSLREAALGAIRSFIQHRLVMAGVTQLLSMLNPVGAIIQAIIKTYTTIQFFIQKINQILDLVESVVNSIGAIASGAIGAAAGFVERTMARTIPVVLDFLARFIGLGDVGGQVTTTIRNLQTGVDRMLDRAVGWIRQTVGNLASRAMGGDPTAPAEQRLRSGVGEATLAVNRLSGARIGMALMRPVLAAIQARHRMQRLEATARAGRWVISGQVNPSLEQVTQKGADDGIPAASDGAASGALAPDAVKARVRADVAALARQPQTPNQFAENMSAIFRRYEPQGLKSLYLDPSTNVVRLMAAASPASLIYDVYTLLRTGRGGCYLEVEINGLRRPERYTAIFNSGRGGPHAEQRLQLLFPSLLRWYQSQPGARPPPYTVDIAIRYSPCLDRCQPVLQNLRAAYPQVGQWNIYYFEQFITERHTAAMAAISVEALANTPGIRIMSFEEEGSIRRIRHESRRR